MSDTSVAIATQRVRQSRLSALNQDQIQFGRLYADHMFVADCHGGRWQPPRIEPYGPISFAPTMASLHYGQTIFEGMKAYRSPAGEVLLFRPTANHARFNRSAVRLCMPEIPEEIFMQGLHQLLDLDRGWVPDRPGTSLYIRPFMFATDEFIGVRPSDNYRFMIITSPAGMYYAEPVRVKVEKHFTRAAPGGTGEAKCGGNYGGSLYPALLAQQQGYHQLIWTDSQTHQLVEEAGTMNVAFVMNNRLVTPPVGDTVLRGITRDSLLQLARDHGTTVEERPVRVDEVIDAQRTGQLQEAFGVGTAATIAHIATIWHEGTDYPLPEVTDASLSVRLKKALDGIRYGQAPDPYGWTERVGG